MKMHLQLPPARTSRKQIFLGCSIFLFFILFSFNSFAQTNTWVGSNGDWHNPVNWDLGLVPNANHDVVINNGDKVTIDSASAEASSVSLSGGSYSRLSIATGITLTAGTMLVDNGQLEGSGTFSGYLTTRGGGNVFPGDNDSNTTGTLTIDGNYDQDTITTGFGGYLNILVKGTGDFSVLDVSGLATLTENLNLHVNYSPSLNDNVVFLTAPSISGTFSNSTPSTWSITYDDPSTGNAKATFDPPPPANDDCSGAEAVTLGNHSNGYTTNATNSVNPAPSCHTGGQYDIWYSFTAPASGKVFVGNYSENVISVLVLYSGTCMGLVAEECVESNSNGGTICSQLLVEGLNAGNTYYLQVVTDSQQGNVGIRVEDAANGPANDFCSGAIGITVGALGDCPTNEVSGTTVDAHHSSAVICQSNHQCNYLDVWYSITTPASGVVKFKPGTNDPCCVILQQL